MSGGLGSSPYVRKRLKSRYETGLGVSRLNAQEMRIVLVAEPYVNSRPTNPYLTVDGSLYRQLAVVQGLVMDRIQAISRGSVVFKERCCRLSYGMICRELYNEAKHIGEEVTHDPRDRQRWAVNQIDWFVVQVSKRRPFIHKTY